MLTNHQKGYRRDKDILETVEKRGVLDTDQVTSLFFPGIKNPKRMAQKRLLSLYERKKLKRGRESLSQPYYYYSGTRPGQLEHTLGLNWVYVWTLRNLKKWEQLHCFESEQNFGILRTDALVGIRNTITGKMRFTFVEVDLAESRNDFDKVKKYNELYQSGKYMSTWWAKIADRFPPVLVVTTDLNRLELIWKRVQKENVNGLEFKVLLLNTIKEECQNV